MVMVRYGLVAALLSLLLLSSSCLTVADDEGPLLSIELYWDELEGEDFEGGTCDSAGVAKMEWTLLDEDGEEVQTSLSERDTVHDCYDAIDIVGLEPGTYRLEITGYDDSDPRRALWTETSGDLNVLRFDTLYSFRIHR